MTGLSRIARTCAPIAALAIAATAGAAPQTARDAPEGASGARDAVICKTFTRTGSLVARNRVCKTRKEWAIERENAQILDRAYACTQRDDAAVPCK